MKNSIFILKTFLALSLIIGASDVVYGVPVICDHGSNGIVNDPGPVFSEEKSFTSSTNECNAKRSAIRRTFENKSFSSRKKSGKWRRERINTTENQGFDKSLGLTITYDDFAGHLELGRDRVEYTFFSEEGAISMQVGDDVGATGEIWDLPNLGSIPGVVTSTIESREASVTPYVDDFLLEDEDGNLFYPTTAYQLASDLYQFLDIDVDDELTGVLYMLGSANNEFIFGEPTVQAPIPMMLGIGEFVGESGAIPCEWYVNGCETGNADEHELFITETYLEVAEGTLNTFDGESSQGLKLHSTRVYSIYDINGDLIEEGEEDYIYWYTVDGHFVIARLADGAPWTGMTSFDYINYQKVQSAALPVEWLAVNAEVVKNREVKVNWSTATESQNERFVVERSSDGVLFVPIGGLNAVGDSEVRQDYTYTDESPFDGFNYYRIQQQDFNGRNTYSSIVSALVTKTAREEEIVLLYPNPGRSEVFFSRPADYELMTIEGQLLAQGRVEQLLDVAGLSAGTYLVRIDGGKAYRWVKR